MSWDAGRLDDRFRALDQHVEDLRETIRAYAPMARQVAVLEAQVEDLENDIAETKVAFHEMTKEMKAEVAELTKGQTEVIRAGRAETVKIIALFVTPIFGGALTLAAALITGRV
jgi:phage host-nuclease inhibitor protein Gam